MPMRHASWIAVGLIATIMGCRSRGEPVDLGAKRDIEIDMAETSGTFEPHQDYRYQLSDCGANVEFIELDASDKLHFKVDNIDSGAKCRLDVFDDTRKDDASVQWVSGVPGVIFYTRNLLVIERGNRGQLRGVAMLSPGVAVSSADSESFRVNVPVSFGFVNPLTLDLKTTIASLACTPGIAETGVFSHQLESTGTFQFIISPPLPQSKVVCSRIVVNVDGVMRYRASLPITAEFTATAGGETSLATSPIKLEEVSKDTATGVEVIIRQESCKDGEVFDPNLGDTGACKPAGLR